MPRQPRPDLAAVPQHVVQRGNDRQPCFFTADDYRRYLAGLRESAIRYDCAVHAYVLMTNHVHLLVTPSSAGAVSRMMQWLGRQYVGYINGRYRRTGTQRNCGRAAYRREPLTGGVRAWRCSSVLPRWASVGREILRGRDRNDALSLSFLCRPSQQ